jgi:dual specificity MAP kinase phosphatase
MNTFAPKTPQEQYYYDVIRPITERRKFGQIGRDPSEIIGGFMWLGDASNAMDTDQLASEGITCVVNCAARDTLTTREYYPTEWKYTDYEASDDPDYNILDEHLDDFMCFMDECRGENRRVLVHCVAGINRSATLCIAYLVIREKMTLEEAIRHCFGARPIILTNSSFVMQLIERFVAL